MVDRLVGWLVSWLVVMFYGMITLVGYLMSNPVYAYVLNMYDL